MTSSTQDIVNPALYDRHYYLTDNEGWKEYQFGLDQNIHPKFIKALELAQPKPGERVLEIGCGRGEFIYYCAKRGIEAFGIDYSPAAIELARETLRTLPGEQRSRARVELGDAVSYAFEGKYDVILMMEVFEHLHDWQLEALFQKLEQVLSDRGRIVMMTPNYYYEKYLRPAKRVLNIPFNLVKWPLRMLRGKYQPKNSGELWRKIFRINLDRGPLNEKLHVNVATASQIRRHLHAFEIKIHCEDHSHNPLTFLTRPWLGRDIIAVASLRRPQGNDNS